LLFMTWLGIEVLPKNAETNGFDELPTPLSPFLRVGDNPQGRLEYLLYGYERYDTYVFEGIIFDVIKSGWDKLECLFCNTYFTYNLYKNRCKDRHSLMNK